MMASLQDALTNSAFGNQFYTSLINGTASCTRSGSEQSVGGSDSSSFPGDSVSTVSTVADLTRRSRDANNNSGSAGLVPNVTIDHIPKSPRNFDMQAFSTAAVSMMCGGQNEDGQVAVGNSPTTEERGNLDYSSEFNLQSYQNHFGLNSLSSSNRSASPYHHYSNMMVGMTHPGFQAAAAAALALGSGATGSSIS
ncbi:hypothetical protein Ciccas_013493, partial [Cichlidogyrus casuarinus]